MTNYVPFFSRQFSPLSISGGNLELWLDAADSATVQDTAGKVTDWLDKSGQGNDAAQGVANDQPTITASAIGTKDAIVFDGSTDNMVVSDSASISLTGSCSFFAVLKSTANGTSQNILAKDVNSAYRWRVETDGTLWMLINDGVGFTLVNSTSPITRDADTVVSALVDIGTDVSFFIDGVAAGTPGMGRTSIADTGGVLLIGAASGSSEVFNGAVGEVLVYDRLLSPAERVSVENYLSNKWGI